VWCSLGLLESTNAGEMPSTTSRTRLVLPMHRWVGCVFVCERCVREGHVSEHCTADRCLEGCYHVCGEYCHPGRMCLVRHSTDASPRANTAVAMWDVSPIAPMPPQSVADVGHSGVAYQQQYFNGEAFVNGYSSDGDGGAPTGGGVYVEPGAGVVSSSAFGASAGRVRAPTPARGTGEMCVGGL